MRDERLGAYLGMVINKKDIKILHCFTLVGCSPLFISYSNKISGFIVMIGETKRWQMLEPSQGRCWNLGATLPWHSIQDSSSRVLPRSRTTVKPSRHSQ